MALDPSLQAAYERTTYFVDLATDRLAIRIGQCHPELDRFLRGQGVRHWCFISAHNPMSRRLTPEENAKRHADLEQAVREGGWAHWPGAGVGEDDHWPAERSLLVAGIDLEEAKALARCFQQAAIVVGALRQPARLEVP